MRDLVFCDFLIRNEVNYIVRPSNKPPLSFVRRTSLTLTTRLSRYWRALKKHLGYYECTSKIQVTEDKDQEKYTKLSQPPTTSAFCLVDLVITG